VNDSQRVNLYIQHYDDIIRDEKLSGEEWAWYCERRGRWIRGLPTWRAAVDALAKELEKAK
jgi:hypothetical protein